MKREIVGLDKAKVFWGLAKNGRLAMDIYFGGPLLSESRTQVLKASCVDGEKPVKVYVLVEDA